MNTNPSDSGVERPISPKDTAPVAPVRAVDSHDNSLDPNVQNVMADKANEMLHEEDVSGALGVIAGEELARIVPVTTEQALKAQAESDSPQSVATEAPRVPDFNVATDEQPPLTTLASGEPTAPPPQPTVSQFVDTGSEGRIEQWKGSPDPKKAQRAQQYHADAEELQKLDKKRTDTGKELEGDDLARHAQLNENLRKVERDAGLEVDGEKLAQMPTNTVTEREKKAQARTDLMDKQVEALTGDELEANTAYQEALKKEASDVNKKWREIYDKPQADKDIALDAMMSKSDQKAYQKYVELRERLDQTERDSKYDQREQLLDKEEANVAKLPPSEQKTADLQVIKRERQALETERRRADAASILAKDDEYQKLQRNNRKTEKKLEEVYENSQVSNEQIADTIRDLVAKDWSQLTVAEQGIFGNEHAFKIYQDERDIMNSKEMNAEATVDNDRDKKNYRANGTKMDREYSPDGTFKPRSPEEVNKEKIQNLETSQKSKKNERVRGSAKRLFRKLARGIDKRFGKEEMNEHGKKAVGYAKRLFSQYGFWRGLFSREDNAKNLRKLMRREAWKYLKISGARKLPQFLLLSALLWVMLPIIIGKGLDMTKPFGGNA